MRRIKGLTFVSTFFFVQCLVTCQLFCPERLVRFITVAHHTVAHASQTHMHKTPDTYTHKHTQTNKTHTYAQADKPGHTQSHTPEHTHKHSHTNTTQTHTVHLPSSSNNSINQAPNHFPTPPCLIWMDAVVWLHHPHQPPSINNNVRGEMQL